MSQEPYKVLGVSRSASTEDLRSAYRKLVLRHHPDTNPEDPGAEERFKEIQRAYELLSDPRKRREIDSRARSSSGRPPRSGPYGEPGPPDDLSDIFSEFRTRRSRIRRRGSWKLSGEEVARLLKILGGDIPRSELIRRINLRSRIDVSYGDSYGDSYGERPEPARDNAEARTYARRPSWGAPRKPPKPPRPPKW